jgi:hypothetical protein
MLTAILIIAGCAVAGYWIVSSVMGPGVDVIEEGRRKMRHEGASENDPGALPPPSESARPDTAARKSLPSPRHPPSSSAWYVVLDVTPNASRSEIQAAMRRRVAQAEAAGDTAAIERIRHAAELGLALKH